MLVVAAHVTQAPNHKEQVVPMLTLMKAQSASLGEANCLLADTGYSSEKIFAPAKMRGWRH